MEQLQFTGSFSSMESTWNALGQDKPKMRQ